MGSRVSGGGQVRGRSGVRGRGGVGSRGELEVGASLGLGVSLKVGVSPGVRVWVWDRAHNWGSGVSSLFIQTISMTLALSFFLGSGPEGDEVL